MTTSLLLVLVQSCVLVQCTRTQDYESTTSSSTVVSSTVVSSIVVSSTVVSSTVVYAMCCSNSRVFAFVIFIVGINKIVFFLNFIVLKRL